MFLLRQHSTRLPYCFPSPQMAGEAAKDMAEAESIITGQTVQTCLETYQIEEVETCSFPEINA